MKESVGLELVCVIGDEYGLIIESEPDEGTKVSIHLPERLEVNENE